MKTAILAMFLVGCGTAPAAKVPASATAAPQATDGSQGPAGQDGKDGAKGKDGAPGKDGARGPAGAKGDQGPAGPAGAQGEPGKDGLDGAQGAVGAQGNTGAQGAQGAQGATGAAGVQGAQGNSGSDASSVKVMDGANTVGELLASGTQGWYVVNGSDRFEINPAAQTFRQGVLLFSGSNCTGNARMILEQGQFANVVVGSSSTQLWRATGKNVGPTFPGYSSYIHFGTCSNGSISGVTLTVQYAAQAYTAPFPYPLTDAEPVQ